VRRRRLGRQVALTLGALALACGPAAAAQGNLYPFGAGGWGTGEQFTGSVLAGPTWEIHAGALSPAKAGDAFAMVWGCPIGGSEIAAVQFDALRTAGASSLEVAVSSGSTRIWAEPDAGMPQSPAGGRAYYVPVPSGLCSVRLALTQVETRAQNPRTYYIGNPRILVRDLAAPTLSVGAPGTGWQRAGSVHVGWTVSDNFGADGVATEHIDVDGIPQWALPVGDGAHGVDLDLSAFANGRHDLRITIDGDGTAGATDSRPLWLDGHAPAVGAMSASPTAVPGRGSFAWTVADDASGVSSSVVEVNTAGDGSGSGEWRQVGSAVGPGAHRIDDVALTGMADGVHAWRVWASDAVGNAAVTPAPAAGRLSLDTTAPSLELHGVPGGWVNRAEIDLTATDNLQSTLGVGAVEVEVNTAADAGEGGAWQRRGAVTGAPGRRLVPLELGGLEDGRHLARVLARNGGPLGGALVTERRVVLRVDGTAPTISGATFAADGAGGVRVAWVAQDDRSGVATASVQWKDAGVWRPLGSTPAAEGAGEMSVNASALGGRAHALRLVIADAAGNTAIKAAQAKVTGGVGRTAADPLARLAKARLALAVPGARPARSGRVLIRRVVAGRSFTLTGRLLDASGHALSGTELQARGHRGKVVGHALTRRDGRFTMVVRPVAGGPLLVGVPADGRLIRARTSVEVVVEVRPRVELGASSTVSLAGQPLLFTGRLRPAPREVGAGSRKGIILEWLDPVRRTWRPVVNARIHADGTFAIPWTFTLSGLTVPMRVTVPAEVGWPLLPARSRVIPVTLR
jgi:hypothetical protein